MRYKNRAVLSAAAAALIGVTAAACTTSHSGSQSTGTTSAQAASDSASGPTIEMLGYSQSDPFWQVVLNGANTAAKQLGVRLTFASGTDVTQFLQQWTQALQVAIAKKPDALLVADFFPSSWAPLLKGAEAQGIPVFLYNGTGPQTGDAIGALGYVGEDSAAAGLAAGKEEIAAGAKNGLCVDQNAGTVQVVARCGGYEQAFKAIGGTVYQLNENPNDANNSQVVAQSILGQLRAHPSINGVLATWGTGGPEAVLAAQQSGRKVAVGNFDVTPAGITDIQNGSMLMTMDQQGYLQGYYGVVEAYQYVKFGLVPSTAIITGPSSINKSNVNKVVQVEHNYPQTRGSV